MAKPKPTSPELDQRIVRALGHPLRQRILAILNQRTASPSELAEALGEPLGKVSYHVQVLCDNDAIELARTRPVRGALEHFYRPLMRPFIDDAHWAELPSSVRHSLVAQTMQQIFTDVARASAQGGFDDDRAHASWTTFELDEEGVGELADALDELLDRTANIQARAAARLAGAAGDRRTELALLHFDRARVEGDLAVGAGSSRGAATP